MVAGTHICRVKKPHSFDQKVEGSVWVSTDRFQLPATDLPHCSHYAYCFMDAFGFGRFVPLSQVVPFSERRRSRELLTIWHYALNVSASLDQLP
jgi:hypothetical protein